MNKFSSIRLGLMLTALCGALAVTPAFAHDKYEPPARHHQESHHHGGHHHRDYRRPVYVVVKPRHRVVHRHDHHCKHRPIARIAGIVGLHALLH